MPSFNRFRAERTHVPSYITPRTGSLTEPEHLRHGKAESEETRIPFPRHPPFSRCSGLRRRYAPHAVQPTPSPSSRSLGPTTWEKAENQNGGVLAEATLAAHPPPPTSRL